MSLSSCWQESIPQSISQCHFALACMQGLEWDEGKLTELAWSPALDTECVALRKLPFVDTEGVPSLLKCPSKGTKNKMGQTKGN